MSSSNILYYIIPLSVITWLIINILLFLNTKDDKSLNYIYINEGGLTRAANLIVITANVYIFIKVAVFFYENFGAKQFNVVLQDKADIVSEYLKYDKSAQENIIKYKGTNSNPYANDYIDPSSIEYVPPSQDYSTIKAKAKILAEVRNRMNAENIKNEIDPWTTIFFWIFVGLIIWIILRLTFMAAQSKIFNKDVDYGDIWHWKVDNFLLFMIVTAFTTELLFFFGIVKQYSFYGDQQIYSKIFSEIDLSA